MTRERSWAWHGINAGEGVGVARNYRGRGGGRGRSINSGERLGSQGKQLNSAKIYIKKLEGGVTAEELRHGCQ